MRHGVDAMRYCAFCANEVSNDVASCPFCGKRLPRIGAAQAVDTGATEAMPSGDNDSRFPAPTYPLPAAGEGATVRGFSPIAPPTGKAPQEFLPITSSEPTLPGATIPVASLVTSENFSTAPTIAAGELVPPAITIPTSDPLGSIASAPPSAAPNLPQDIDEPRPAEQDARGIAPMPVTPPALMSCLPYVFAVMSARRARAHAMRTLETEIEAEQQQVHEALRDLGQTARRAKEQPHIARSEIDRLVTLEEERKQAEAAKGALDAELETEEARFAQSEKGHRSTADAHRAELTAAQGDLEQVDAEIARHQGEFTQLETQEGAILQTQRSAESAAKKTTDEEEKRALIRSSAEQDVALDDLRQRMEAARAALATATAPQAALEQRVTAARAGLQQAEAAIAAARNDLEARRINIDEQRRQGGMQVTQMEREIMHAQVVVGSILDTHRPASADDSFEEHYSRIDKHHQVIDIKQRNISAIGAERESYDREAHKKGLMLMSGAIGLMVVAILVLVLVL